LISEDYCWRVKVKLGLFSNRSGADNPSVKRRYPVEYISWRYWELGLPLASPTLMFVLLLVIFLAINSADAPARAVISISGSGDLLIFSALLLINVGAKLRILQGPRRPVNDVESGEFNPEKPFFLAFMILFIYSGVRVALETLPLDAAIRFMYGLVSVVVLLVVVIWIDSTVRKMHTDQLILRLESGMLRSQYNR